MLTVCSDSKCTGCMACINVCRIGAISFKDDIDRLNCVIDEKKCINCGRCHKVCPNNKELKFREPYIIKQGWAEDKFRSVSSSGGVASAIMESFIKQGGYVCSCIFESGEFIFKTTSDSNLIPLFAGSKYVKTNPQNAYIQVKKLLEEDKKILFIGLPCQSAGIQSYFENHPNLYTIDLICHGTPSKKLLDKYLVETRCDMHELKDIKFRYKDVFGLYNEKNKLLPGRIEDSYLKMFLNAVDYSENCYACKYASFARISDITLGDAWGQLSETTDKGVSLILCQSPKGKELIGMANLKLLDVNVDKAVSANHQLRRPSIKHVKRKTFIAAVKRGCSFRYASFLVDPRWAIKQSIKYILIKMKIIRDIPRGGYKLIVIKKCN